MVELMLGSPLPAAIAWGPELTVIYNDGFDAIDNFSDPPPLGRPFTKVWPKPESDGIVDSIRQGQARQIIDRYWDLPARTERPFGWFTSQWTPLRDEAGGFAGFYLAAFETTDRVLVERALLEREEQQAFVLGLSDALRPLADPLEVQAVACRLLGEHLQADYTYYLNLYEAEGFAIIAQDFARAGLPSRAGKYPLSLVGWAMPHQGQGQPIAITDVQTSPLVPDDCRERVLADRVVSLLGIPLAKQGRLVGALALSMTTPREWTPAEIALATEIGERTWAAMERARAEKTAREADIRLRTLADAAPVLIWDADSSGTILVNDHYLDFFGVGFEAVAGYGWQKFLHPEDAERHLSLFQEAFAQRHCFTDEARLRRADGQYRWLSTSGRPLEDGRFVGVSIDVTERRLAEQRVRRNNAVLQAINLVFSETLGASSEEELARISLEVAEELTGSAIGFIGEINETTGRLDGLFFSDRSRARYAAHASEGDDGFPMGKSALGLAIHGIYGRVLQDGAGVIVNDPASHPDRVGTPAGHLPLTAFLGVPLKQGDRTRGLIGLGNRPGGYRPEDLEAAEALAPAIWHALRSKRAELRLRESEERFRQFAEASSDVLWIRDAETFEMEFVSPALRTVYGIEPNVLGPEIRRWAGHMLPEDRENALQNLQRAATGQSLLNEFRIKRPSDGAFRWIRSTLFPLRDEQGRVRRIGGLSSDMTEAKLLIGHQAVLLAELQHRVRNIMAVTRSIVARTGERAETVSDYASLVGGRLLTLARVQALLTRSPNAGVPVATMSARSASRWCSRSPAPGARPGSVRGPAHPHPASRGSSGCRPAAGPRHGKARRPTRNHRLRAAGQRRGGAGSATSRAGSGAVDAHHRGQAAIDGQHRAGDVGPTLPDQEGGHCRDLFRLGKTPERDLALDSLAVAGIGRQHFGIDEAGRDDVDGDAALGRLDRQRAAIGDQGALGRRVGRVAGIGLECGHRTDGDDAAGACPDHPTHQRLGDPGHRPEVHLHRRLGPLTVEHGRQGVRRLACIVDVAVEALALGPLAERLHRVAVRQVEGAGGDATFAMRWHEFVGERLRPLRRGAVGEGDGVADCRQGADGGRTETGGAADDEDGFSFVAHVRTHAGSSPRTRQVFCPPKPKEFERIRETRVSRAVPTTSRSSAGSGTA